LDNGFQVVQGYAPGRFVGAGDGHRVLKLPTGNAFLLPVVQGMAGAWGVGVNSGEMLDGVADQGLLGKPKTRLTLPRLVRRLRRLRGVGDALF